MFCFVVLKFVSRVKINMLCV